MSSTGAIPKGGVRSKEPYELQGDPLDKKFITLNSKGVENRIPALHSSWVQKGVYVKYDPPPLPNPDGCYPAGARESWQEQMEFMEQELQNLLKLPHHRFWSQVIYDPEVHESLESYLSNGPRWYDDDMLDEFSRPIVGEINRLVFLVYMRMATFKESKTCHITPSVFGEIIYDNFLFDVCKILDICVVFGPWNSELIARMISNIFSNQPKYYGDLAEIVPSISVALDNIEDKLNVAESYLPVNLRRRKGSLELEELHDLSLYLLDTFYSLHMLLSLHQAAAEVFHESTFELRLSACYERVIPVLMENLSNWCQDPEQELWAMKLIERIQLARTFIIATFRCIIEQKCFVPLQSPNKASQNTIGECIEKFLQTMSNCTEEKVFISDYGTAYPIQKDSEFFQNHEGDVTSLGFITDAVKGVMLEMEVTNGLKSLALQETQRDSAQNDVKMHTVEDGNGMNGYAKRGSSAPSDVEMASMVSTVQDLLPDLGTGFIQECLKYYNYSTEEVINALLEDNLPPSLATLDRTSTAIEQPAPPTPSEDESEGKMDQQEDFMERRNVYNDDEFDVFSKKSVDRSKIHKGKKPKSLQQYQPDESALVKVKELGRIYEERGGTSIYEDEFRYVADGDSELNYEDEYDDTYDDDETGNIDDYEIDKTFRRKPGLIGAGALNKHYAEESEEDSEEDIETLPQPKQEVGNNASNGRFYGGARAKNTGDVRGMQRSHKPYSSSDRNSRAASEESNREVTQPQLGFVPFCENPEEIRRRKEQRRLQKQANRGHRGHGGPPSGGANAHNGFEGERKPQVSLSANKNSGKQWRHGEGGDNENRKYHGGKYKEDTNHGKAQSREYRNKMQHKNEHKRQGAQAKFNRNN